MHHPVGVPPLAHTAAPCGRSPHRGAPAVPTPRGCKAPRRSSAKKRGALTDPVAAAARRPPQRDESSSMRICTGTTGAPATPKLGEHHRPPTPDAGPRGPAPSGRTSPPFSRRPIASDKQRFKRTLARWRAKRPAHLPPSSRGQRPIRYREDHTPRTRDQGSPRPTPALRKERGGSPPRSPEAARPRRAHRGSRNTTRADQGRTQRRQGPPAPRSPLARCPPPRPARCPGDGNPPGDTCLGDNRTPPHGTPPRLTRHWTKTGWPCPPRPPRPPQQWGTDPFDDAELRAVYDIHASTPSSELVATLREHLRSVDPNRLFAVVPLPHAPTTQIFVRQLQALVTPGTQVSDDLIEAWIWWFNTHQPAQGGVWVPHLGWVHTLIAPPTDPRPAPATGGRERAAPPPRPDNLRIPPHEGPEAWESGTARTRGHNLTNLTAHYPETTRAASPPRERDPGTIAMIVLENGHYYQVRIIPHPQDNHWSLEAVDSMLRATTGLMDNPTPLLPNQPPDPLTAIVSGAAGT